MEQNISVTIAMTTIISFLSFTLAAVAGRPTEPGSEHHLKQRRFWMSASHPTPHDIDSEQEAISKRSVCSWTYTWSSHDRNRIPHKLPIASCKTIDQRLMATIGRCQEVHYHVPVMRRNNGSRWEADSEKVAVACTLAAPNAVPARSGPNPTRE